jgi:hypothetical protein
MDDSSHSAALRPLEVEAVIVAPLRLVQARVLMKGKSRYFPLDGNSHPTASRPVRFAAGVLVVGNSVRVHSPNSINATAPLVGAAVKQAASNT